MDGVKFGAGVLMLILSIDIVQLSLQLLLVLWVMEKVLPLVQPKVVRLIHLQDSVKESFVYFISTQIAVLLLALPIVTVTDVTNYPFMKYLGFETSIAHLSLMLYFIVSLTHWEFDGNFNILRRIPKKKIYYNAFIVFYSSYVLQLVGYMFCSYRMLDFLFNCTHFSLVMFVAIYCINRNNRALAANSSPLDSSFTSN